MSTTPAAKMRIDKALQLIQSAQTQLGLAMSELSTLRNIGANHSKGMKLYDQIHSFWYRIQDLRDSAKKIETDSEPIPVPLHVVQGVPK